MASNLQNLLSDVALKLGGNDMSVVSGLLKSWGIDPEDDDASFSKEQADSLVDYLMGKLGEDEVTDFINRLGDMTIVPTSTASLDEPLPFPGQPKVSGQDAARQRCRGERCCYSAS